MSTPDREHILFTVLGRDPKGATYVLAGKEAEATLAPVALYFLLPEPDRPHRIVALCTDKAEQETLPVLQETLGETCTVEPVRVRADHTEGAVDAYLATLAKSVPDRTDLTVDVTHGLRHMSFLTYVGVLYLTSLRQVRLRGAYYGMLREPPQTSPFLDLRPLVELPQWFHAVRMLKDTGSAHAIAELVSESAEGSASRVGPMLRSLSEAYGWGLPLELGYLARHFLAEQVDPLRDVLHAQRLPLADELVASLTDAWTDQQIQQELPDSEWKSRVRLGRAELERQARLIDGYLARKDYSTAFGLMREWLVLWSMWRLGQEARWLEFRTRDRVARWLHGLGRRSERGDLPTDLEMTYETWASVTQLRNHYRHHALDKQMMPALDDDLSRSTQQVVNAWQTVWRHVPEFSLELPPLPELRILVSPVGLRPGALYSALCTADPGRVARCLVICSDDTAGSIEGACRAAGYAGDTTLLRFADPLAGTSELKRLEREAKQHLRDASEVYVNITGGTTLMGVLADRIARSARSRDLPTYRFALADRRPAAEQQADPYQTGDVCWLDEEPQE